MVYSYKEYESPLTYMGIAACDFNWSFLAELCQPTVDLRREIEELKKQLDLERKEEPSNKKGLQSYRAWIESTHELRDKINSLYEELEARDGDGPSEKVKDIMDRWTKIHMS